MHTPQPAKRTVAKGLAREWRLPADFQRHFSMRDVIRPAMSMYRAHPLILKFFADETFADGTLPTTILIITNGVARAMLNQKLLLLPMIMKE